MTTTTINPFNILRSRPANLPNVTAATESDTDSVLAVLTSAFRSDPAARWIYPAAEQYEAAFPELARRFGGRAFARGTAWHIDGWQAAALWLPPGVTFDEEALVALLQDTVSENLLPHVSAVFEQMTAYHPAEPHWHLPLIGVDPAQQGLGLGSALLRHALRRCDRDRVPAYLESSNPRNSSLYERHGFRRLGEIQAGDSPTLVPMLRPANPCRFRPASDPSNG
jgi:ribosomal protein S18 acetylase RimI-like enzyme